MTMPQRSMPRRPYNRGARGGIALANTVFADFLPEEVR
jgi:hypothetical protein